MLITKFCRHVKLSSDLVVTPTEAQIVSVAQTLHMSCSLNLDATYTSRTVTWKLNDVDVRTALFI